ncbi:hypothetical protein PIB30_107613, partial [Stylosanthes scabra]|nr:hypothetical protein [Stylosanthes scabra]
FVYYFNIIIVKVIILSAESFLQDPVIQDYVQPAVTFDDIDSDLIEGSSHISLNSPTRYEVIFSYHYPNTLVAMFMASVSIKAKIEAGFVNYGIKHF